MTTSGVSGYSYSGYSYNNYQNDMLNSSGWTEKAEQEAEKIKNSTSGKTSSASSTGSSTGINVSSSASTSTFLLGYQSTLEDLEASASKLQVSNKNNVFDKYESALAAVDKNPENEEALKKAVQAEDDVIAAFKDFANKYNNTMNYLSNNQERGSGIAAQLESFKRMMPNEKTLSALGMSYDTNGKLQVDEEALREALQKEPDYIKDLMGGQFGIAERVGSKATSVLDSSVDKIIGSSGTGSTSSSSSSSGAGSASTAQAASKNSMMSDSFMQFASFARSGAYNLSNYYAVSMLNILV